MRQLALPTPSAMRLIACLLMTLACGAGVGCGKSVVDLQGKVTQGGKPLPHAEVRFVSQGGSEEVFIGGMTDETGALRLDTERTGGVPAGRYKITVSWWVLAANGRPLPEGEEGESLKHTPAARENTASFEKEITPGTKALDLDVVKGDS